MSREPKRIIKGVPDWIPGIGIWVIIILTFIGGKKVVLGIRDMIDQARFPEYYEGKKSIEAESQAVSDWFFHKINNIPDTVSNPEKYENLLITLFGECSSEYSRKLNKAEIQLKRYYGKRADRVNITRLAKKDPFEFMDYLMATDSLAYDSLVNNFWPEFELTLYSNPMMDSLQREMDNSFLEAVKGVYFDSITFSFIENIIPENDYILLIKNR